MGKRGGDKMPKIFHVNWFQKDESGKFEGPFIRKLVAPFFREQLLHLQRLSIGHHQFFDNYLK